MGFRPEIPEDPQATVRSRGSDHRTTEAAMEAKKEADPDSGGKGPGSREGTERTADDQGEPSRTVNRKADTDETTIALTVQQGGAPGRRGGEAEPGERQEEGDSHKEEEDRKCVQ